MIEIKKEDRKKYQYNMKKRENQKLFNILNYEKYDNLKYEKNDNLIKRYSKYDEELKNIEILENKEYNIYQLKLNDYIIYLRDKIELSFFFNKYFMIEYQEKREKYKNFIEFHKDNNFYMIKDEKIIILDYEKDIIKK